MLSKKFKYGLFSLLAAGCVLTAVGYLFATAGSGREVGVPESPQIQRDVASILHFSGELKTGILRGMIGTNQSWKEDQAGALESFLEILSFEASFLDGYQNPACKTEECHIFGDNDDQMTYRVPEVRWLDPRYKDHSSFGEWLFTASICIPGAGDGGENCHIDGIDNEELIAVLPWVKEKYCLFLNDMGSVKLEILDAEMSLDDLEKFKGKFSEKVKIPVTSSNDVQKVGCITTSDRDGNKAYHFYRIIFER